MELTPTHKNALAKMQKEIETNGHCRVVNPEMAKERCAEINELYQKTYVARGPYIEQK